MERLKHSKALGLIGLLLIASFLFTACKNPVSLFEEVKVEVMKANDRVLNVELVNIPRPEGTFNPTDTIDIRFDKEIDLPSYSDIWKYVRISKTSGVGAGEPIEYSGDGIQYIVSTRTLRIQIRPYLEANTEFLLEIDSLVSAAGNYQILEKGREIFRTSNVLVGRIVSLSGADGTSLEGHTRSALVDLVMHINSPFSGLAYRYEIYITDPLTMVHSSIWYDRPTSPIDGQFTHSGLNLVLPPASQEDGPIGLIVRFYGRSLTVQEKEGLAAEASIIMDREPPSAGSLIINGESEFATSEIVSLSFTSAPEDQTSGVDSLRFSNDGASWSAWEDYSAAKSWNLLSDAGGLSDEGDRLVHYQVRDKAGNIIDGQAGIHLDLTPPVPPVVSGLTLTNSTAHEWTWVSGGGGIGTFRYQLNGVSDHDWVQTVAESYAAAELAPNTPQILYVQERDDAGNWSASGSWTVEIDTLPPAVPLVSGPATTNILRPLWTWSSGGNGGNGNFQYRLGTVGSWTASIEAQYESGEDLEPNTAHTLYVRERDAAGNWSDPGSWTLVIDTLPPNPPIVSGPVITNRLRPTWTWISGGGGGGGEFRYQFNTEAGSWILAGTSNAFQPPSNLPGPGTYTLYVQERDAAGNWSDSGFRSIVYDPDAAAIPEVSSSASLTNNQQPTWTWAWTGEDGLTPIFQYRLGYSGDWSSETGATSFTPGSPLPGGTYTLYVQQRDQDSSWSPSGNWSITIDIDPPYAPSVTGASPTNNRHPTWSWTSGGNDGAGIWRYQLGSTSGAWTDSEGAAFTPGSQLAEGSYTLYVQERDAAGNWSTAGSLTIVVDLTPPAAPSVTGPTITNFRRPTWSWTTGGGGGSGNYEYQLNGTNGSWSQTSANNFTPASDLAANTNHTLYVRERDAAGNWSGHSSFTLTIDTIAPAAPSTPVLDAADDSGSSSSDNITRYTTGLTFSGNAEANTTVQLKTGTTVLASTTANSSGFWSLDISRSAGTYAIYAVATDLAGNTSPESSSMTLTVDTSAPAAPSVPDLAAADDSGSSSTDNITRFTTGLTFSGTSEAFATVQLKTGTTVLATTTANSAGAWSVDISRSAGTYSIYAVASDLAGNTGPTSASMTLKVDTMAPAAPSVPDLAAADDSGSSSTDNITKNTSALTFSGTAEAYATVQLKTGTTVLATTTASSAGAWSVDISRSAGTYSIYAVAIDEAGNTGPDSASMTLTVDTTAPTVDTVTNTANSNALSMAYLNSGSFTFTAAISNGGTPASALQDVKFYKDTSSSGLTNLVATDTTSPYTWSWNTSGDNDGTYYIKTVATDLAGNESVVRTDTRYLDKVAPTLSTFDLLGGTGVTSNDLTPAYTATATGSPTRMQFWVLDNVTSSQSWSGYLTYTASGDVPNVMPGDGRKDVRMWIYDAAGNHSYILKYYILDQTPPSLPSISASATTGIYNGRTTSTSVTWDWSGGGGGNGIFRFALGATPTGVGSTTTSYSTSNSGNNVLYVQEQDVAGNWSSSRTNSVRITSVIPFHNETGIPKVLSSTNRIQWRSQIGANEYRFRFMTSTDNGKNWSVYTAWVNNTSTAITSGTLPVTGIYRWQIQYGNKIGIWTDHPDMTAGYWQFTTQ